MHDFQPSADLAHAVAALRDDLTPAARPFVAALLHAYGPEADDGDLTPATRWAAAAFDPMHVGEIHKTLVAMVEEAQQPSAAGLIEHTRHRARLTAAGLEREAQAATAAFVTLRAHLSDTRTVH